MDLEGDSPAPRPPSAPERETTPSLHVTPENVVALAAMFRRCADGLAPHVPHLDTDLRLKSPWMRDPVSEWAQGRFNEYFVDNEHSFVHIVQSEFAQHTAMSEALVAIAQLYGLTEELISAGLVDIEQGR